MNVRLPTDLHDRLHSRAKDCGISMQEWIRRALRLEWDVESALNCDVSTPRSSMPVPMDVPERYTTPGGVRQALSCALDSTERPVATPLALESVKVVPGRLTAEQRRQVVAAVMRARG